MDIAALSMAMSLSNVQQSASISILKKAMDTQQTDMSQLVENMETAAPSSNQLLDITV